MNTAQGREQVDTATTAQADAACVGRLAAGDLDALEELYERHKGLGYAMALRITRDPGMAEDAVQEAFLGAWRTAGRFDPARASVKTWIMSIVHNRSIDALRRRRPTQELPAAEDATGSLATPDVWGEVSARLDASVVRAAMGHLPSSQREALELAYFDGLTQTEIAARTDAPLGTVKGRLRLGLGALRDALGDSLRTAQPSDPGNPR